MRLPLDRDFNFLVGFNVQLITVRFIVPNGREFLEQNFPVHNKLCVINPEFSWNGLPVCERPNL